LIGGNNEANDFRNAIRHSRFSLALGISFRFTIILITGFLSRFSVKGYQAIGNPFLSAYKPF
jgi:hypothetical protein